MARRKTNRKKNTKVVALGISIALLLLTIGIGVAIALLAGIGSESSSSEPAPLPPAVDNTASSSLEGVYIPVDSPKSFPEEMRGVLIRAGDDYDPDASEQEIKNSIDSKLASAKELTMNTVVIDLSYGNGTIANSSLLPTLDPAFDSVAYLIDRVKEQGFYVYVYYPVMEVVADNPETDIFPTVDTINRVRNDIQAFCYKYQPNGVLIDGYYAIEDNDYYGNYVKNGGAEGYDDYLIELSEIIYKTAVDSFREYAPWLHIGMVTEPVWENYNANELGSRTNVGFTTYGDANFDSVKILVEEGYADFLLVKTPGSTEDSSLPFELIADWWGASLAETDIPFYCLHYSSKAVTDNAGWTEYDQLARQVIAARELSSYGGGIFNSISRMEEDPKEFATSLVKYYQGEMKEEHITTDLAVVKPENKTYTTFEPTVTFSGVSDPNTPITVNSQAVDTDQNGYFTLTLQLDPGLNTFAFSHKGKTDHYNITRHVQVVQEVTPQGNMALDGGMKLRITAVAYEEADVYAEINGVTVTMTMLESNENEDYRDSSYRVFEGSYTVPQSTSSVQQLGSIVVYGKWGAFGDNATGANVTVNKTVPVTSGQAVRVTSDQAETLSASDTSPYSTPDFFPLPSGAIDYTVGSQMFYQTSDKTYAFYRLQSGVRVNTADLATLTTDGPGGNSIKGITVTADERYTNVIINTEQQVSFKASYSSSAFKVAFNFTDSVPPSINLSKNPLFSAANWSGSTLTLPLVEQGAFMGMYSYFDSAGNLVLRFNNAPESIDGAVIVIDPGHGVGDIGAKGFDPNYHEADINLILSEKTVDELKSRGATVYMLPSDERRMELEDRTVAARDLNPHLFVSIHCNSHTTSSPYGTEAYYFYPFASSLATTMSSNVTSAMQTTNRGGKYGNFYVIRAPQYASVLLETGFVSNKYDYQQLLKSSVQNEVADGIADAIQSYFSKMETSRTGVTGSESAGVPPTINTGSPVVDEQEEEDDSPYEDFANTELSVGDTVTLEAVPQDTDLDIEWDIQYSADGIANVVHDDKTVTISALSAGEVTITVAIAGSDMVETIVVTID